MPHINAATRQRAGDAAVYNIASGRVLCKITPHMFRIYIYIAVPGHRMTIYDAFASLGWVDCHELATLCMYVLCSYINEYYDLSIDILLFQFETVLF